MIQIFTGHKANAITAKVSLTSSEILNINSTPKQLLPAPGVGYTYEILGVMTRVNFGSAAYATNTTLRVYFNGSINVAIASNSAIIGSTATRIGRVALVGVSGTTSNQCAENAAVLATVDVGNPTTGDSTMDFYVTYKLVTL